MCTYILYISVYVYIYTLNILSFLYMYTLNFESFPVFDSIEPIGTFHFLANVDVAAFYDPMRSKLQSPCFHEACRKQPWRSTQRSRKCYSLQTYWLALCAVCNTRVRSLATLSFLQIRCPSKIIYTYLSDTKRGLQRKFAHIQQTTNMSASESVTK